MRIPGYRLHRGSGRAIVTLCGKDFYLGRHGTPESKRKYERLIAEYLSNRETFLARTVRQSDLTIAELLDAFVSHASVEFAGSEFVKIKIALRPVKALYADFPAKDFGPQQLRAVRHRLMTEVHPKRKKLRSRVWINLAISYVVRMFRWGASEELVPPEIHAAIKLVPSLKKGKTDAPETTRVTPVSLATVEATLKHCTPVIEAMVRVQLLTGCRPGEVCRLTPGMIDRRGTVWVARLEEHKTAHRGRERFIYFGPKSQAVLFAFMDRPDDKPLFSPRESEEYRRKQRAEARTTPRNQGNRQGYTARTRANRPPKRMPRESYDRRSYGQALEYAAKKANIRAWGPNRLRHAAATQLRADFGIETASAVLGHSELRTTEVYAERDAAKAIAAALQNG
ncbi:MAG: site-specific integrase [Planctomycetes bacterium]|nr:site-specific integrase [Planctomycetota bacterium]